jgi:hypothetical protein
MRQCWQLRQEAILLALKLDKGQDVLLPKVERQAEGFCPRALRGTRPGWHLGYSPGQLVPHLRLPEL